MQCLDSENDKCDATCVRMTSYQKSDGHYGCQYSTYIALGYRIKYFTSMTVHIGAILMSIYALSGTHLFCWLGAFKEYSCLV